MLNEITQGVNEQRLNEAFEAAAAMVHTSGPKFLALQCTMSLSSHKCKLCMQVVGRQIKLHAIFDSKTAQIQYLVFSFYILSAQQHSIFQHKVVFINGNSKQKNCGIFTHSYGTIVLFCLHLEQRNSVVATDDENKTLRHVRRCVGSCFAYIIKAVPQYLPRWNNYVQCLQYTTVAVEKIMTSSNDYYKPIFGSSSSPE